jgi:hypothetical protein
MRDCLDSFKTESDYIQISFITTYCFNCSILLLGIVVNLLLCLAYKLNFIIGIYVQEKTWYLSYGFRHPLEVLEHISCG